MTLLSAQHDSSEVKHQSRRTFILGFGTAIISGLAGCSDDSEEHPANESSSKTQLTDTPPDYRDSEELNEAIDNIQEVYHRIQTLPVVREDEFVFDIEESIESFDYEDTVALAEETVDAANGLENNVSDEMQEAISRAAWFGFLLVKQRVSLHHAIVDIFTFNTKFSSGNLESATDSIQRARRSVTDLSTNLEYIDDALEHSTSVDVPIDGYDPQLIDERSEVVDGVLQWITPVCRGLDAFARGMVEVIEANDSLEEERVSEAQEHFGTANELFRIAADAFDAAHGSGRQIDRVTLVVEEFRCAVTGIREWTDEFSRALDQYSDGEEETARELTREARENVRQRFNQCS